ncbi:hypothetical protein DICA0_F31692 [Diutina catenulata]
MLVLRYFECLWILASVTFAAKVISEDTVTLDRNELGYEITDLTINPGVFWSILGNVVATFKGNLNIGKDGGLFITSTSNFWGLNIRYEGGAFNNKGTFALNSIQSGTAASYVIQGSSFENSGEMFLSTNGGFGIPNISLKTDRWVNSGLLSIYQQTMSKSVVLAGSDKKTMTNTGNICIYNSVFAPNAGFNGKGCIQIFGSSCLTMSVHPTSPDQVYLMHGPDAQILTATSDSNVYTIAGFGNGNVIGFSTTVWGKDYDSSTGVLTVYLAPLKLITQKFQIGKGYNPNGFATATKVFPGFSLPFVNAVTYKGAPPANPASSVCGSCETYTTYPTTTTSSTTSSSTTKSSTTSSSTTSSSTTSSSTKLPTTSSAPTSNPTSSSTTSSGIPSTASPTPSTTEQSSETLPSTSTSPKSSSESTSSELPKSSSITGCPDCTEFTTTWTTTDAEGNPETDSGVVAVTTDSQGSLTTSTSAFPKPSKESSSITGCPDCTEFTTTWTTTDAEGNPETDSGVVAVTTDSQGSLTTSTSAFPKPSKESSSETSSEATSESASETGCPDCTEFTTTWTTTDAEGNPETDSGVVAVTTDSQGSLTTSTSAFPKPSKESSSETSSEATSESASETGCPDCTEFTTTWTTTDAEGNPETDSGVVAVTTDSQGSLTTSTSAFPKPSKESSSITGCPDCTEFTTTWTTTDAEGNPETDSGVVAVTTDSQGSLTTSTSAFPKPSKESSSITGCPDCTEFTTTWTTTDAEGNPETDSGVVAVTTDSQGSLTTSTSAFPKPSKESSSETSSEATSESASETGCPDCTEFTTTWTTTDAEGNPETDSGVVAVTTDSQGSLTTSTSAFPKPSKESSSITGCPDCTEFTTTWTTTDAEGNPETDSGVVAVTTDSQGSLTTSTSAFPKPSKESSSETSSEATSESASETGCPDCTEFTTTWTTTDAEGNPETDSGVVAVTTDSQGSLTTSTSAFPKPSKESSSETSSEATSESASETGCPDCTEFTTTWTTTDAEGNPETDSGVVAVTTDSQGSLTTSTSAFPKPSKESSSITGCPDCTEFTTTWTTTDAEGNPETDSGVVAVTTDSQGSLTTSTSAFPKPSKESSSETSSEATSESASETGCPDCTEFTTTWTTTDAEGNPETDSGVVAVTTDSQGSLTTSTSAFPKPSKEFSSITGCPDCTEFTTTWTTTDAEGNPETDSGVVAVTTDSQGSLTTSTSAFPKPSKESSSETSSEATSESASETGCPDCTEFTTTWTTTDAEGNPETDSGVVAVTTDSQGSLTTSTSAFPKPSKESSSITGCPDCTEFTTTWTTTDAEGNPETDSGVVAVTTDSQGSLTTSTSAFPKPSKESSSETSSEATSESASETGCPDCTEFTTTWTTTDAEGNPETDSGVVAVTTDSQGSLTTSTSAFPKPSKESSSETSSEATSESASETGCPDCTEFTTTWTTTDAEGNPETDSGVVAVTTDSQGSLTTSTSAFPKPSKESSSITGCPDCTEFTTTWTTTDAEGNPETDSGVVAVTTDSQGSLTTSTSAFPKPSKESSSITGCPDCTEFTTTWTTTDAEGNPETDSGVVAVTTDSQGSLTTSTSAFPKPSKESSSETSSEATSESASETGCPDCTEFTTTWTTTDAEGNPETDSGVVAVTTDSQGSLTTSTSAFPKPSKESSSITGCPDCTEFTTTWTTTDAEGNPETDSGVVAVTTDSQGSLTTSTSAFPKPSKESSSITGCPDCTEFTTTWTTTDAEGNPETDSGVVAVTTDSQGSLTTSTSAFPKPSKESSSETSSEATSESASETGCPDCTEFTTTWTTTDAEGNPETDSGVVAVTTDSQGSLTTSTSAFPKPSKESSSITGCPDCTEFTTTWTTTDAEGNPETDSGVVAVTTDSQGSLTTSTSAFPKPSKESSSETSSEATSESASETGCPDCTEFTTTWTTTDAEGNPETDSGVVAVTTDSQGSLTTSTSAFPKPSKESSSITGCPDCTEFTTTWTTTDAEGNPETDSGVVAVTTDSQGSLTTSTSAFPKPSKESSSETSSEATSESASETGCPDCTEFTTTWTTTDAEGNPETDSGVVAVTTDSQGSLTTSTSAFPKPSKESSSETSSEATSESASETGCPDCTEFTTTWTTTDENGNPETGSGIVDVTTGSDGSLTTSTSLFPKPSAESSPSSAASPQGEPTSGSVSETGCPDCTEYTTTWTTTDENGNPETGSGIVDVTTDSDGSLTTSTSLFPKPSAESSSETSSVPTSGSVSETGCPDCTEYTTTWTTTDENGNPETGSGIVDVTTGSDGSLTTSTSSFPKPSAESSPSSAASPQGEPTSGSVSETGCPDCTEYTTTWTTTDENGNPETGSGIVDVTTGSDGSLTTSTSSFPKPSAESSPSSAASPQGEPTSGSVSETGCPDCTEYTTTWTTTDENGNPETGSGIVDVTTDSDGSLTTSTSQFTQSAPTGTVEAPTGNTPSGLDSTSESHSICPECTHYTTTWNTSDSYGNPETGSGIVDVTTDSNGSLTTSTSRYPEVSMPSTNVTSTPASDTGCPDCTHYTSTWTTTDAQGNTETGSGIVDVTTDSIGSLVTSTSAFPTSGCTDCTRFTSTWTSTGTSGEPGTYSGIVDVTTDSMGSLTTSVSTYPESPSSSPQDSSSWTTLAGDPKSNTDSDANLATNCPVCTQYPTTVVTTGSDGSPLTYSGLVDVTTDSLGSLTTSVSTYPSDSETPSVTGTVKVPSSECPQCTHYPTTVVTTGSDGQPTTYSGMVDVTTDSIGSLTTSTSAFPDTGCPQCTQYPTTVVTTGSDGQPTTYSGMVDVTTDSIGSLTTSTSAFPDAGCPQCTHYPTTVVTTGSDGQPTTYSGMVDVTTDSIGSLTTSTSAFPDAGCPQCTQYPTTVVTTGSDGQPTTYSGMVDVTTDSNGSLVTSTATHCAQCTQYPTVITTAGADNEPTSYAGIVDVTTDDQGSLVTTTVTHGCPQCTVNTCSWTTTGEDGKPTTGSGVVDVVTDSNGSLVITTSTLPGPETTVKECPVCTAYPTTWASVGSDGKQTTVSAIVDVNTNSQGQVVTVTKTECDCCTAYPTQWTSVDAEGRPSSYSGEIVVTTNSAGATITHSSVYTVVTHCASCTAKPTVWTVTGPDGKPSQNTGVAVVTTQNGGELTTSTCTGCTVYTTQCPTTNAGGYSTDVPAQVVVADGSTTTMMAPPPGNTIETVLVGASPSKANPIIEGSGPSVIPAETYAPGSVPTVSTGVSPAGGPGSEGPSPTSAPAALPTVTAGSGASSFKPSKMALMMPLLWFVI